MNTLKRILKYTNSNTSRNAIIIFGFCVSFITITSFESISNTKQSDLAVYNQEKILDDFDAQKGCDCEKEEAKSNQKIKTRHNFIASYLLQESSRKRENKKANQEGSLIRSLIDIHRTIIVNAVGLF